MLRFWSLISMFYEKYKYFWATTIVRSSSKHFVSLEYYLCQGVQFSLASSMLKCFLIPSNARYTVPFLSHGTLNAFQSSPHFNPCPHLLIIYIAMWKSEAHHYASCSSRSSQFWGSYWLWVSSTGFWHHSLTQFYVILVLRVLDIVSLFQDLWLVLEQLGLAAKECF